MASERDSKKSEIEGIVKEMVIGGQPRTIGSVIGDKVYNMPIGGQPMQIGYVKDGIAYEIVIGGPARMIGIVDYNYQIK